MRLLHFRVLLLEHGPDLVRHTGGECLLIPFHRKVLTALGLFQDLVRAVACEGALYGHPAAMQLAGKARWD